MEVTKVTMEDGRRMADVINLLKAGRWDMSAKDMQAHTAALGWLIELAKGMASGLIGQPAAAQPSNGGMKVTGMGPLGTEKVPGADKGPKTFQSKKRKK